MATSGRGAQEAIRARGSKKCAKHYGKDVIYVCEDCDVLACVDCATQQHKRHALEGISNVVPQAKQKLQDFLTRAEQTELPRIKKKFHKVNEDLSKNKEQFQTHVSQIQKRNEILKKELDKISDTLVKTCHDMEHQISETLLNHLKEQQIQMDELCSKIQEVKASLQSGNDVLMLDTSYVLPSEVKDLPTPVCSVAKFTTGSLQQLEHLFGELNITDHSTKNRSLSLTANLGVVSEFTPNQGHTVKSIHATGDKTWLSLFNMNTGYSVNKILSVNQKGQVQQTLDMVVRITDFCISPQTGNIWFCSSEDSSLRDVKGIKVQIKFTTDTRPLCICVTRDDLVLVGDHNKQVVKYTQAGQQICTTSRGKPSTVRYPWHLSECPMTGHIAVVDRDFRSSGGNNKPFVSILNDRLQLLHTYNGEISGQQLPPRQFYPNNVCFTDAGELVITDAENKTAVLVSGSGKYLQTLLTQIETKPWAVCVHCEAMWISFHGGKVKVFKNN